MHSRLSFQLADAPCQCLVDSHPQECDTKVAAESRRCADGWHTRQHRNVVRIALLSVATTVSTPVIQTLSRDALHLVHAGAICKSLLYSHLQECDTKVAAQSRRCADTWHIRQHRNVVQIAVLAGVTTVSKPVIQTLNCDALRLVHTDG